jgi:hypothetical protein
VAATQHHILARLAAQVTSATATLAGYDANDSNPANEPTPLHRRDEAEGRKTFAEDAYALALKAAVHLDANPLASTPTAEALETHARLFRLLLSLDPNSPASFSR